MHHSCVTDTVRGMDGALIVNWKEELRNRWIPRPEWGVREMGENGCVGLGERDDSILFGMKYKTMDED